MQSGIFTRWARRAARATTALALVLSAQAASAQAGGQAQAPSAVQVQDLSALDLWSAAGRDTGLPADLWRGASAGLARPVLTVLPDRPLNPAMAVLARRLFETGATAPEGAGSDTALAALRVRALVALGSLDAAQNVLARTPSIDSSEPLSRAKAEVALLAGRDQEACDTASALQQGRDGAWWLKLRAYCSLVAKQGPAAQVTLDLWRQGGGRAPNYERLMNAAINGTDPGKGAMDDPLDYALSRRLNLDLTAAVATAPLPETVALARDTAAPQPARLEAVARALRFGGISVQTARDFYISVAAPPPPPPPPSATPGWKATPTPQPDPATLATDPSAHGEAALYAEAATSQDPAQREAAIIFLLGRSKTNLDYLALAHLARPAIADLAKAGTQLHDPVLFAAAAASAGDAQTAATIRATIQENASPTSAPLDLARLDALIAERSGQGLGPALDRLVERGGTGELKARATAQSGALLLAQTGAPLSPQALAELSTFEPAPGRISPARRAALYSAADAHRAGAAALIALAASEQATQGLAPPDRADIAGALKRAGFVDEAQDLVAQGLISLMGR